MKRCELCKSLATIYCESDQASLCWSCDAKVHSANFLVARHPRSLLCCLCHSLTTWTASGRKLAPSTMSVCETCVVDDGDVREESHGENDGVIGKDDDENDGGEDGEEQFEYFEAVPWSSPPPPAAASFTSSEELVVCNRGGPGKRKRQNVADLSSVDDCSSVPRPTDAVAETATRGNEAALLHLTPSNAEAIVGNLKRIRHGNMLSGENKSTAVVGMSKGLRAVGLELKLI